MISQVRRPAISAPPIKQPTATPASFPVSLLGTVTTLVCVGTAGPELVKVPLENPVVLLRDVEEVLKVAGVLLVDADVVAVVEVVGSAEEVVTAGGVVATGEAGAAISLVIVVTENVEASVVFPLTGLA
jgi:hypothetical protein